MAIFHTGHQLGAVGEAFMCAAIDQAPAFIDGDTGEDMESALSLEEHKAELKQKVHDMEIGPLRMEHIYHIFPKKEKK